MNIKNSLVPSAGVERILYWIKTCKALCVESEPLSASEKAEFDASRAREMAKAQARRQSSPQGNFEV